MQQLKLFDTGTDIHALRRMQNAVSQPLLLLSTVVGVPCWAHGTRLETDQIGIVGQELQV